MRNDPSHTGHRDSDAMGLGAVVTGYAALAIIFVFFVVLLFAGHRHSAGPKQTDATQNDNFGIEELVDLLAEEPAVLPADLFVWPKPRPITRAGLDPEQGR